MMSEENSTRQILNKHKRQLAPFASLLGQLGITLELILSSISRKDYKTAANRLSTIFADLLMKIVKSHGLDETLEPLRQIPSLVNKHKETIGIDRNINESLIVTRDFINRVQQGDGLNFHHLDQGLSQLPTLLEWYQAVMSEKDVFLLGPDPNSHSGENPGIENPRQPITDVIDGDTIGKKYKVEKEHDKGGMAKIYKVFDRLAREYRAIKTVPHALSYDNEALEQLRNETNNAQKISHPNVIRVYDLIEDKGRYLLVMEYIDGKNLYQVLKDSSDKKLKEHEVLQYMIQVSKGLEEIHRRGIVHLDLKPKNLMLTNEGEIKILDFSISKMRDQLMKARSHTLPEGTLPYMAPEQLSDSYGSKNEQTDIWSLGATMYFLLCGKYPFGDDNPNRIINRIINPTEKPSQQNLAHVSAMTGDFVMKCLQKERTKRYKSMKTVLKELNRIKTYLDENDSETIESTTGDYIETSVSEPEVEPQFPHVLRFEPCKRLSKEEVIKMIKEKGFFDSNWNRDGEFKNQFELKSFPGGQVVIATTVGLMWHPGGTPGYMGLARAGKWLEELNNSSYAGFSDWRIPTLEEAASLLRQRQDNASFYTGAYFSLEQQCIYTGDRIDETRVWLVDFKEGNVFSDFPNYGYIRPVRSVRPGEALFEKKGEKDNR
jgi:serine/threonine protein kinase